MNRKSKKWIMVDLGYIEWIAKSRKSSRELCYNELQLARIVISRIDSLQTMTIVYNWFLLNIIFYCWRKWDLWLKIFSMPMLFLVCFFYLYNAIILLLWCWLIGKTSNVCSTQFSYLHICYTLISFHGFNKKTETILYSHCFFFTVFKANFKIQYF